MNSTTFRQLIITIMTLSTLMQQCRCASEAKLPLDQSPEKAESPSVQTQAKAESSSVQSPDKTKSPIDCLRLIGIVASYSTDNTLVIDKVEAGSPASDTKIPQPGDVVSSAVMNKGFVAFDFSRPGFHWNLTLWPKQPSPSIEESEGNSRAKTVELDTKAILLKKSKSKHK